MKHTRYYLLTLLLVAMLTPVAQAQRFSVDFRQAANKHNRVPAGEAYWINSIVQRSNSVYTEGMSVPQRLMFVSIPARPGNNHSLDFSHQATKSGRHAYDYLTSYSQALDASDAITGPTTLYDLNECGNAMGPPTSMPSTCASIRGAAYSYTVDIPDAMGSLLGHSVASSIANYEANFGNRTITLHGNAPITSAVLVFKGYSNGAEKDAEYTLNWTSSSTSILVEMAGHLAMGNDFPAAGTGIGYGAGLGAGSISGASFHFKLGRFNNMSLGSRDNQVMGSAVSIPLSCNVSGLDAVCSGSRNSYAYANAANGLSYAWSLSNNSSGASIVGSSTGASVSVDAGSTTGGYTLTVTVSDGSMSITCPTVVTVDAVTASALSTPIICSGGTSTITVSATGGAAPYTGTGTFTRTAGTYLFTVTDAKGCTGTTSVTVVDPPSLNASAQAGTFSCATNLTEVNVTANGGKNPYKGTGKFYKGNGIHHFTVTDVNGCSATTSVMITQPTNALTASAAAATPISCFGGSTTVLVTATGGTAPYTGTGSFTRGAGTWTFTVTDANNCSATTSITLTQPASGINVSAIAASQINCYGGTTTVNVNATGGTPPYQGIGTFTRGAGTWTFTVADANNCSGSATITLNQPASGITVSAIAASQIDCYGGTTTVNVTATGGTPPYTGTGNFTRGAGTWDFTVTDANNCSATTSITLTQPASALGASATAASQINCYGGTTTVNVTATGGTPPYAGTGTFTRGAGTWTFTVTDANNCSTTATITLTQPASGINVSAIAASQINCYGGTTTVNVTATGGTPPYTGTGSFTRGAGTWTFTVTDANNCSGTTSITLTQPASNINVSAVAASQINCYGGTTTVNVTATGGTPPYQGTGQFTRGAGTWTFTVTDNNNCTGTASITLTQPASALGATAAAASLIDCYGGTTTVNVTATGGTPPYAGTGSFIRGAGTWTFPVTDANNCATTATITITQPASALSASASAASQISCYGGTTTVDVTATGGTPPYAGTGSFTRGAGTWTFTVTDANNCSTTATITLTQPSSALAVAASATPIPCGGGNSTVTVTASGGTAPYTGTGTFSAPAGTHTYTVTDANGCSASATVNIQAGSNIVVSTSATPILCNGGSSTVTVTATGGTAPYVGTGTFTVGAGTHYFTVSDANSCSSTDTIVITQPAYALSASATATQILCHGDSATVNVTATGGTAPYTGTGMYVRSAGTWNFTVTDANNCSTTASVTITQPQDSLIAAATAPPVNCNGGNTTVTVTASGGTPPYAGTGSFTRPAGTWTFTVTDANNCSTTTTITITQPGYALVATASATPILCAGGLSTVTVTATGGTAPYGGTGTFSVPAGIHNYTVTDANGCTSIATVNVTAPPQLSISAIPTPILCNGGTSTVTVGAAGGTPPYSGTGTFLHPAGTYTFTVTDANNCTESVTITIGQPPVLDALASATTVLCNGGNATISITAAGGTGPYSGTGTFTRTAGTYTFTVTDANNCWDTVTVIVTEPPVLTAAAHADTIFCNGGSVNVTVSGAGGTPPYIGVGTFTAGAGTHTYTVTDANGCTASTILVITEPPLLVASWTAPPIQCNGESTTVTVSATGGTPPYTGIGNFVRTAGSYSFTVTDDNGCSTTILAVVPEPPPITASAIPTPILCYGGTTTITVAGAGGTPPYSGTGSFTESAGTYTYIVTDANGCSDTATVTVTEPPVLNAQAGATQILCYGGTATVTVTASGGTPGYSGTGTFYRTAGTYTFGVTDANGCTANVSVTIIQPPPLTAGATATPIQCYGDSAIVTVTASGGTPPYTGIGSYVRAGGSHTFTVTDYHGCTTSTTILVVEPPALVAAASAPPIACHGGVTTVTVSGSGGTPPYNGVGGFVRGAGTHTFIVTDANGCADTTTIIIDDPPALQAASSATTVLCYGDDAIVTVTASGGTPPYFGTGTYTRPAGTYTFYVTDSRGCNASTTVTITEPPQLSASASAPPVTCGRDSSTVTVTATGGTPPYSGTGIFKRLPGTHTFVVTDANGCTAVATVTVIGPPPLIAAATWTPILCNGGTSIVTVTATGGTAPITGTGTFSQTAGTYTYIISDANGCLDSVQITIVQPAPLTVACTISDCDYSTNTRTIRPNASGGTPPYSYLWMPGNLTSDKLIVPCSFTGTVTVRVRDANYNPNDPNNSSCEAWCSLTIMVKANGEAEISSAPPTDYALLENYPNPFNPSTTISYYVPELSSVQISVINTLGRTVATLVDDVIRPGSHAVQWNGLTSEGTPAPSGSYIYRMHAQSRESAKQYVRERLMMLLK